MLTATDLTNTAETIVESLSGATLAKFAHEWILEIDDLSWFVAEQRSVLVDGGTQDLLTPRECVYMVSDPSLAERGLALYRTL